MSDLIDCPFHAGERTAQARAGVAPGGAAIRDWMPDQHRAFFLALPLVLAATVDEDGWPVATVLTGQPGFIASPDARTLRIDVVPDRSDPAGAWFAPGARIGLLGIDLATRRRNRVNGTLRDVGPDGLVVSVEQSFGNCPQYIQTRFWQDEGAAAGPVERLEGLDESARLAIGGADTFFVASSSGGEAGAMGGVDISHRGGRPGFVAVDGDTLVIQSAGFNGGTFLDASGAPHTDDLVTVERVRKVAPTQLEDVITVHDPEYYTGDWQARFVYTLRNDVRIEDYVCGEKHRDLSSVKGVRRP